MPWYVLKDGQVIRISFSNMFKEFKSTATWLQFPFLCGAAKDSVYECTSRTTKHGKIHSHRSVWWLVWSHDTSYVSFKIKLFCTTWVIVRVLLECRQYFWLCDAGLVGRAPTSVRWTCLMMDLQFTLSVYLNRHYSHLKSIKLCANMAVKNMFTSDLLLDPGENQNH